MTPERLAEIRFVIDDIYAGTPAIPRHLAIELLAALDAAERRADEFVQWAYVDDHPCRLDHDGHCQTHFGDKPCGVAKIRELLTETPS